MQSLAIIGISIASAIVYGILHDMITVRLCAEYFTVAHPNILRTEDPNELALFWGIVATWWVGLGLGVGLACIARIGQMPKRTARSLVRPIMKLMAGSAVGRRLRGASDTSRVT
ncbi:MAG: hypothetical protein U0744_11545 [Gemmataceae bacterium]